MEVAVQNKLILFFLEYEASQESILFMKKSIDYKLYIWFLFLTKDLW
jgi:hypothetical protein